jgi:hypothetical protein
MSLDDLKVEALPPDRGTVVFIAQTEGNPTPGVEIKIDGKSRGFTGEDGKLKVEWLLFGEHTWGAMYEGNEVSQGEFEIEKVADIKFLDRWTEVNGRKTTEFYPLKDTCAYAFILQNTGTTIIDMNEIGIKWESYPTQEIDFKLIRPAIPSFLTDRFKKVMLNMFHLSGGRSIATRDGIIFLNDSMTASPLPGFTYPFILRSPEGEMIAEGILPQKVSELEEGLRPGMMIEMREVGKYEGYIGESMRNLASEMNADVNVEILDRENGILKAEIKRLKVGPMELSDVQVIMRLKGSYQLKHEVSIGNKLCDSEVTTETWLCSESEKTLDELLK